MGPLGLNRARSERGQAWGRWLQGRLGGWRKALGGEHPLTFGRVYAPEWMPHETPEFHWEIADTFRDAPRFAVAAPVGSAKTMTITKLGSIWSAFCEPVQDILIVSSAASLAQVWIEQMGTMLKSNEALQEDYGNYIGVHWSNEHLELQFKERRCFIRGVGIGGAIRGRRPDRLIVDDPEDEAQLKSEKQMREYREWFWGALVNRLDDDTKKLTYIGTCISEDAMLTELITRPRAGWVCKAYAALNEETGRSLWESKWPESYLRRRREEVGEDAFQREFQNNPVRHQFGKPFNVSMVKALVIARDPARRLTVCFDPAFRAGGDAWAYSVVEWLDDGTWHVREIKKEPSGLRAMLDALVSVRRSYPRFSAIGVEAGAQQVSLEYAIADLAKKENVSLPVTFIKHTNRSGSKQERLVTLSNLVNRGVVTIDPSCEALMGEMRFYTLGKEHQDDHLLDSLAMHMELMAPKTPHRPHVMTPEEERHLRYRAMTYWKKPRAEFGVPGWQA